MIMFRRLTNEKVFIKEVTRQITINCIIKFYLYKLYTINLNPPSFDIIIVGHGTRKEGDITEQIGQHQLNHLNDIPPALLERHGNGM